ncbi:cold shock domain-containing protein [Paeniclostridium sordellii]|uniref:cold-shock protein n=1 Tax=Paraclostridium sordellii TaxID=1505 RepID=UPI00210C69FA|nr:cold shock domain-containing protein [Paeniclostridium sordellii]MCQ4697992.1 cold shock domain-containing protein [Paeniclostridium sordellii]
MNGIITYFYVEKGYGFIKGDNMEEYFFHISSISKSEEKNMLREGMKVSFNPTESYKGKRAINVKKLGDYRIEHLQKRLTQGKKSKLVFKGSSDEKNITQKFSEFFGVTFSREEQFKKTTYYFNFLQPSEIYRESFNMFNEVLMIFSTYDYYDERAMDYVDKLFMDYSNRLDPVVIILVSKDKNIKEIIKKNNTSKNETRIIVPFTYNEILSANFDGEVLQSRLREYFYQRDLFAMESPLKSDNYFYGRSNIVHNFFDKYSIGEQAGLFGLRKTGKTSVLYAVERLVEARKGMSIIIDCQSPGVYNLRWYELLKYIINCIKDKYDIKLDLEDMVYDEKNASEYFLKSLKLIKKIKNKRILMIFDEIEHITFELSRNEKWKDGDDYLSFWQTIRSIIQSEQDLCSFIIAGVNPMITEKVSIKGYDNPIFNNVSVTYLNLFSLEDVKNMTKDIGNYMGLSFDENVYFKLHNNYGGHPFLIRNVCSMLNGHFPDRPYKITNRDFDDFKDEFDSKLTSYIQSILFVLESWYPNEFEILKDIALENKENYIESIKKNELSIIHLLGYGIIEKSGKNNYYIEIEAIKKYMNNHFRKEFIPNDQEEFRAVISERRNNIEIRLRRFVRQGLSFKYGRDGISQIIEKHIKTSINSVLERRNDGNLFNALYFSELKNIIFGEYAVFKNSITIEKSIFMKSMNEINKYRHVDAHAGEITRKEYSNLHIYFNNIEEILEDF